MNIEQMRVYIAAAYPGKKWKDKCYAMHDTQVVAVFRSLTERKAREIKAYRKDSKPKKLDAGYQFTIFDYGVEKEA